MQKFTTIIGVIKMRENSFSYNDIRIRYGIGNSTITLIINRYQELGIPLEDLESRTSREVENMFFSGVLHQRKEVPLPDYEEVFQRLIKKGSKTNLYFLWLEYKVDQPMGYQYTQFVKHFHDYVTKNKGNTKLTMPVERVPGEILYLDWIGDQPEVILDRNTGELIKAHIFLTTIGVSSYVYAEAFLDEKLPSFLMGTVHALDFYHAVPKILKPDNCKTAVLKHTKDDLVLNAAFQDLENFYDTTIVPAPPRKPKAKPTVENHVRWLETHLIEKLKDHLYSDIEEVNVSISGIIAELNNREFQKKAGTRKEAFCRYDLPHMKPLPGESFTLCDYRFPKVPDNYHLSYDGHYYSVPYTYLKQEVILKATLSEIRICDRNNRMICRHARSYRDFPIYVTVDDHMPSEHAFYKEVNTHDSRYYLRWAKAMGEHMELLIQRVIASFKHEEQSYKSCNGILHSCEGIQHHLADEAARKCIELNTCNYSYFKKVLASIVNSHSNTSPPIEALPQHGNIRGKDYYR